MFFSGTVNYLVNIIKTVAQLIRKFVSKDALNNPGNSLPMVSIYDISLQTIEGKTTTLKHYQGKKMLIVNTASACGYTPQYAQLEELHQHFGNKLVVLGFPCNDFGAQEPGDEAEIKEFCEARYGVTFPLFSKLHVSGDAKHPLYKWLTDPSLNGWNEQEPTWNFCKYLLDENGKLLHFFSAAVSPLDERITG